VKPSRDLISNSQSNFFLLYPCLDHAICISNILVTATSEAPYIPTLLGVLVIIQYTQGFSGQGQQDIRTRICHIELRDQRTAFKGNPILLCGAGREAGGQVGREAYAIKIM
jgi:hypothetical protein